MNASLVFNGYPVCQALCIVSNPLVNSNWGYSPEALNSVQKRRFLSGVTLKFDG